ncbi:unnamed protein product [Trichobilharzia szidati]|nr:unnamed protein product [Trichobilharzia szidati]
MEVDNQKTEHENEVSQELSSTGEVQLGQESNDRKDDDEEEEEEEEEDKIVEKSHNSRFHKRNKRFPKQIEGVDNAFVAIEPKSGKEVIWNECILPEKKTDKENRYLSLIKKLKKNSHPFLVRFLDAWVSKTEEGPRKLVFITERLDECTLKQFLCNSARNNRVSTLNKINLLSKLWQPPSWAIRCLDQKSEAFDVYSLGVVSLEIAVWTPLEFPQNLDLPERCQLMMSRLDNNNQKSFIEACFDTSSATKGLIKRLLNHPAVTEVPILKLLSARMIVNSMISVTNEEGGQNEPTGFASLLKDYLSRYEDETVIMEVHFPHDKLVKTRLWKDFRSNFTLTSKYLEDVKNGFYPLFGCRWDAYQGEDEEGTCVAYTGAPVPPPTNGLTSNLSTGSGIAKNDPHVSVGYCSSCTSTTPSTSVSRKHSLAVKLTDLTSGSQFATEDQAPTQCEETSKGCFACNIDASHVGLVDCLSNQVSKTDSSRLFKVADTDMKRDDVSVKASEVPGPISVPTFDDDSHSPSKTAPPLKTSQTIEIGQAELKWSEKPFGPPLDITEKSEIRGQNTLETREDDTCLAPPPDEPIQPVRKSPLSAKSDLSVDIQQQKEVTNSDTIGLTEEKAVDANTISGSAVSEKHENISPEPEEEDGDVDEDDDKDDEDDDNGDDDDDEDEKRVVEPVERYEPQTVHVNPPERAPNHPALFTHCQYLYVGAGRWQVYVQMWFVEDRLKRETYVQVFDYEWHDHERVADLFEASKCLSPVDRSNLVRLLALARHNCALIDGELQFPGPIATRQSNFDTLELHEKLAALHLHQQAKELLVSTDSGASKHAVHSSSVTPKVDSSQASSTKHEQVVVVVVVVVITICFIILPS